MTRLLVKPLPTTKQRSSCWEMVCASWTARRPVCPAGMQRQWPSFLNTRQQICFMQLRPIEVSRFSVQIRTGHLLRPKML